MAERLVTPEDLEKYPQLISKGVSVNTHYDFDILESAPSEVAAVEKEEHILETPKPPTKKRATKTTHKATPVKQKAKRR